MDDKLIDRVLAGDRASYFVGEKLPKAEVFQSSTKSKSRTLPQHHQQHGQQQQQSQPRPRQQQLPQQQSFRGVSCDGQGSHRGGR